MINKRIGHAALEVFLILNGMELEAGLDDSESVMLRLAAGQLDRAEFVRWVGEHLVDAKS